MAQHRRELFRLTSFALIVTALVCASYVFPATANIRPWIAGEPIPLVHLVTDRMDVLEDQDGNLQRVAQTQVKQLEPQSDPLVANLPLRPPAIPTPLLIPEQGLDNFFSELAMAEDGAPGTVVRVLHWGDSTIAGDGIIGTVRSRLQDRFGDGGPGFLAIDVDPLWSMRPGILRKTEGVWESAITTFGGVESNRYGLGSTVSTARSTEEEKAQATLGGLKLDGNRQLLNRIEVYYQLQPGGGSLTAVPQGMRGRVANTDADDFGDRFLSFTSEKGTKWIWLQAEPNGPVTLYGVTLETAGPGITWENLGVMGASVGTMLRNARGHHIWQIRRRDPKLVVLQTGGNELSYPGLANGEGKQYRSTFGYVLKRLKDGAPDANCLVIGPLDQATRVRNQVISKPLLERMINIQRDVAIENHCAFWDTRHVMGGEGGFKRWLDHSPRYAWTDLMHLTTKGLDLVGDSLADAIEDAYDRWRTEHPEARYIPPQGPILPSDEDGDEPLQGARQ